MTTYTLGHHESVLRSHKWRTVQNSAGYLRDHLVSGARVLDVGCGPGTITAEMASLVGSTGAVVGVDISSEVVALAQDAHKDVPSLSFEVGDISAPDGSAAGGGFDVVHAHQVLQHLGDPVGALRVMRSLTREGGVVAVREADYAAMSWYPELPPLDEWRSLYRRVARHNGAEPDAGRRLLSWASQAGFTVVAPSASVWCFASTADRAWWGGLQADRIVDSAVATQALDAGFATHQDLATMREAWLAWAADPDAWFVVVHGEVLCEVAEGTAP